MAPRKDGASSNPNRSFSSKGAGDPKLGPLAALVGEWKSLPGRGWNMIALPFADGPSHYRLLLNRFEETISFDLVDQFVPNRGITSTRDAESDQFVTAINYRQAVVQIAADDVPHSGQAGAPELPIHLESGLWLNMHNQTSNNVTIARLSTIPHGDALLALGSAHNLPGAPEIPEISGLPVGIPNDLHDPYLAPYAKFHHEPFKTLFDPVHPNALLRDELDVAIATTTVLSVSTETGTGGIHNIPFIAHQTNAQWMRCTFWIEELDEERADGQSKLRLQYSQEVMLDFFERPDGNGLIGWPHITIDTLEKVS